MTSIEPGSPAELAGLKKGDVIVRLGKDGIESAAGLIKVLWRREITDTVEVSFWRSETQMQVTVTLTQRPKTDAV